MKFLITYLAFVTGALALCGTPSYHLSGWQQQILRPLPPDSQITKEVEMTARKYEYAPNKVEVKVHTLIRFKIKAEDRDHGFEIEGVQDGCAKLKKGEVTTVEYMADKAGTFEFKCCQFCGFGHRRMKGVILVR